MWTTVGRNVLRNSSSSHRSSVLYSYRHLAASSATTAPSAPSAASVPQNNNNSNNKNNNNALNIIQPDFDDTQAAFATKSNAELWRALFCFSICQIRPLVWYAQELHTLSLQLLGSKTVNKIMKATLFGHFCAGENEIAMQPKIDALKAAGIGSILDYAAEDDGTHTNNLTRVYDYESEAKCNDHVETFKSCINSVSNLQKEGAFAAIKITALGNPLLLERMSRAIVEAKKLFAQFDKDQDGFISKEEFEAGLGLFFVDNEHTKLFRERVAELQELDQTNMVDYITWSHLLAPKDLPELLGGCREHGPLSLATPTLEEVHLIDKMYERGHTLAQEASKHGVRLLVDAEQTHFQPAIDNLVLDLQRQYNQDSVPIIYNTYQCYLKDATARLTSDVMRSERYNYHFGAKLVRGAYMESERKLAKKENRDSPILGSIQETHECYNNAIRLLLKHSTTSTQNVEVMCATHNQESIETAIQYMSELGIPADSSVISFGQLYGMMDNLTYNLGKHHYRAYKYVPYGEVGMVMPYLIRRAKENSAIAGGALKELRMIVGELSRRAFSS